MFYYKELRISLQTRFMFLDWRTLHTCTQ